MTFRRGVGRAVTRRQLLFQSLAGFPLAALAQTSAGAARGRVLPPDWSRYADASTEFEVLRLTDPAYETLLPSAPCRTVTRRGGDVLTASRRTGTVQAHMLDPDKGGSRVLTEAADLDPRTLTLSPDDRAIYYFDGPELKTVALGGLRDQTIARVRDGWTRSGALSISDDNVSLYFVESRGSEHELRRVARARGAADTLIASAQGVESPIQNPRRAMVLWRGTDGRARVATLEGQGMRAIETPAGEVLQAMWSPDGQSVLYLLQPSDGTQLNQIREQELDSRSDRLVAKTSQFVAFTRNANGSVYLGASRNKAAPCVLVLLRSTRREFTLCEHRAAAPASVALTFSPNSQWVFFQSDRDGRPAVYGMKVEKLIEKTDS